MKFIVLSILFVGITFYSKAQVGVGGMGGQMPGGGMRSGGMHHDGGYNRQLGQKGDGNFFVAQINDTLKISGSGTVKIKNGMSSLALKTQEGKEITLYPSQVVKLSHATRGGMEDYVNFENKYWLGKFNKNVEIFYQPAGETDLVFIKENGKFRIATKNDIIDLVKDNKEAYKYAKKGDVKKSLNAYIGSDAPPAVIPQNLDGEEEKRNKPLFNAQ